MTAVAMRMRKSNHHSKGESTCTEQRPSQRRQQPNARPWSGDANGGSRGDVSPYESCESRRRNPLWMEGRRVLQKAGGVGARDQLRRFCHYRVFKIDFLPSAHLSSPDMAQNTLKTQIEAAKSLGISSRQLRSWAVADWFPRDGRTGDGWNVEAISKARDVEGLKGSVVKTERQERRSKRERLDIEILRNRLASMQMVTQQMAERLFPRGAAVLIQQVTLKALGDYAAELPVVIAAKAGPRERAGVEAEMRRSMDAFVHSVGQQFDAAMASWDQQNF